MKPLDIRCNHQERMKAADILGDALSAGQINLDEFEKRSAACVNAATRAELIEPLADLVEDPEVLLFGQERKIAKAYAGQQESKAIAKVEQAIRQVQPSVQETRSLAVGIFGGSTVSGGAVARSLTALVRLPSFSGHPICTDPVSVGEDVHCESTAQEVHAGVPA